MRKRPIHWKRIFGQSTYITAAWNWFIILAGKAAEPVLVVSVLYASVKLLPLVHFPPQLDVVVFIAQFIALDVGGLSLNKLADQAKKEGNDEGAKQARRLSLALVAIMLIGVIMAGVDQIMKLEGQVGMIVDTILVIARAVLAVLYSRVIHSLRKDDESPSQEVIETLVHETVSIVLAETLKGMRQEIVTELAASLSRQLSERDGTLAETVTAVVEAAVRERMSVPTERREAGRPTGTVTSPKVRSIAEARRQSGSGVREIDQVIWPLLEQGLSVRAIAARANTSTATVGRSRKRWLKADKATDEYQPEILDRDGVSGEAI